ncbi:tRNA pseudouridine(13) synthase TruD [Proteobacteria bacterium 005FR1]|nr:tRNA pseudouridine(13) synthase TruD [Proteobacteria bacterium 005FR1]
MADNQYPLDFAFACGEPTARAFFRTEPEDFQVDEDLGFVPTGEGEHVYLQIRKRNQNTMWIAKQLARFCGVESMDVGYCGLKDRNAVTTQWFSIYLPKGPVPNWSDFAVEGTELLTITRHVRKLKPGAHRSNHFVIRLRELVDDLGVRLEKVPDGVPNYFGEQRFGIGGGNLIEAERLLVGGVKIKNRKQRGLIMSAARSYLFNRVLSTRVEEGSWRQLLEGDVGDVPTGPLWGRGRLPVSGQTAAVESRVLAPLHSWCEGLEHVGLQQERRATVCIPQQFAAQWQGHDLQLSFGLAPGQYATAVLREICRLEAADSAGDLSL